MQSCQRRIVCNVIAMRVWLIGEEVVARSEGHGVRDTPGCRGRTLTVRGLMDRSFRS